MAEFPPLTDVAEYPLHGWDYGASAEYACKRPEDPNCHQYDWRCRACVVAAEAQLVADGDHEILWRQDGATPERRVLLSWLIERSLFWLDGPSHHEENRG